MAIKNLVVISDTHCGCRFALCPPKVRLDGGAYYHASSSQTAILGCWHLFWDDFVPRATKGEPYSVVVNGDCMDGRHHKSTTQISQNLSDQQNIAYEMLYPIVEKCDGRFYMIRGSEAHTGQSAENEEKLATALGAIPDENGHRSRHEMYIRVGENIVHVAHHIGTTSRLHYETSALMAEMAEFFGDSARWDEPFPQVVARSHRHRNCEIVVPTHRGSATCFATAGWQLKTPFVYRLPGGRVTTPMIGGSVVRQGDRKIYTQHETWQLQRPKLVIPEV